MIADLRDKMVLLSGPRQSGKATLARAILAKAHRAHAGRYLNATPRAIPELLSRRGHPGRGSPSARFRRHTTKAPLLPYSDRDDLR